MERRTILWAVALALAGTLWGWTIGGGLALGRADPAFAMPGRVLAAVAMGFVLRGNATAQRIGGLGLLIGLGAAYDAAVGAVLATSVDIRQVFTVAVAAFLAGLAAQIILIALKNSRAGWVVTVAFGIGAAWASAIVSARLYSPAAITAPPVALLTGLPIVWASEPSVADILAGSAIPSPVLVALRERHPVIPIDSVIATPLDRMTVLLVAHPPGLAPGELAAIDAFVRGGGRALVLADALSSWPPEHPLGDARNPAITSLLGPLLSHWGLALEIAHERRQTLFDKGTRVRLESPGRLVATARGCTVRVEGLVADCTIGRGKALVVADADFLRPEFWAGARASGTAAPGWSNGNIQWLFQHLGDLDPNGLARRPFSAPVWVGSPSSR